MNRASQKPARAICGNNRSWFRLTSSREHERGCFNANDIRSFCTRIEIDPLCVMSSFAVLMLMTYDFLYTHWDWPTVCDVKLCCFNSNDIRSFCTRIEIGPLSVMTSFAVLILITCDFLYTHWDWPTVCDVKLCCFNSNNMRFSVHALRLTHCMWCQALLF